MKISGSWVCWRKKKILRKYCTVDVSTKIDKLGHQKKITIDIPSVLLSSVGDVGIWIESHVLGVITNNAAPNTVEYSLNRIVATLEVENVEILSRFTPFGAHQVQKVDTLKLGSNESKMAQIDRNSCNWWFMIEIGKKFTLWMCFWSKQRSSAASVRIEHSEKNWALLSFLILCSHFSIGEARLYFETLKNVQAMARNIFHTVSSHLRRGDFLPFAI